mmetsp:Transcript_12335/g.18088  ORF Transcript_12335/g.18088 Transcript_12335/m.18088 type:complete len:465 (+) Transcript_12335:116-1510(+)
MMITSRALVAFLSSFAICSHTAAFTQPSHRKTTSVVQRGGAHPMKDVIFGIKRKFGESTRLYSFDDNDEDEDNEPLSDGVDSVSWLPSVIDDKGPSDISSVRQGAEILPLFPLGGIVYTPNSEHVLNIFEPRYRKMYTDILMNGTKRFVVSMSHPEEQGRFAQTGVLFELEDLKEVSGQTNDQIKYICNHRVTGRVKLHRVINPSAWESRDTYLTVEGTIFDDTGKNKEDEKLDEDVSDDIYGPIASAASKADTKEEKDLKESFASLVDIQHELEEDVRFTKASVEALAVKDGSGEEGLWQTIRLWQAYADQRLVARQNELQKDFQEKLQEFLKKDKGMQDEELPSAIGFQDLSPALQKEVQDLQKRMTVELKPLILESTLTMQKILEADGHEDRCNLLRHFIDGERKRLAARKTLRGMFSSTAESITAENISEAEQILDKDPPAISTDESSSSSLLDEPDAFQ